MLQRIHQTPEVQYYPTISAPDCDEVAACDLRPGDSVYLHLKVPSNDLRYQHRPVRDIPGFVVDISPIDLNRTAFTVTFAVHIDGRVISWTQQGVAGTRIHSRIRR